MSNKFFDHISKPTLLLDEAQARRNIHTMVEKARNAGVIFRPHFKTHQSLEIGRWFRGEGVNRITVSSVDMAEYFALDGWEDITIAFSMNPRQMDEIENLGKKINLGVLIENREALILLKNNISYKQNIWLKIDTGTHRTGLDWENKEQIIQLISEMTKNSNLEFKGILTHAGSTYKAAGPAEAIQQHLLSTNRMLSVSQNIVDAGFPKPLISVGDTPGCSLIDQFSGVDEIRPGNFVFYDAEQMEIGSCSQNEISVALACPIVAAHPERDEIVVYGGAVHLSKESYLYADKNIYGLVALSEENGRGDVLPGCYVSRLSQEHGILHVPKNMHHLFPIGGLALVIPTHSCLTAHLMRRYLTLDGKFIDMMPI